MPVKRKIVLARSGPHSYSPQHIGPAATATAQNKGRRNSTEKRLKKRKKRQRRKKNDGKKDSEKAMKIKKRKKDSEKVKKERRRVKKTEKSENEKKKEKNLPRKICMLRRLWTKNWIRKKSTYDFDERSKKDHTTDDRLFIFSHSRFLLRTTCVHAAQSRTKETRGK